MFFNLEYSLTIPSPYVMLEAPSSAGIILNTTTCTDTTALTSLLLPCLPPILQQQVATDPKTLDSYIQVIKSTQAPHATVTIHGQTYPLSHLQSSFDNLIAALAAGPAKNLWGGAAPEESSSSEAVDVDATHSVVSAGIAAVSPSLTSRIPAVRVDVRYASTDTIHSLHLLPTLTGLQMKSAVINQLGLGGGFQDYYLRCENQPFGSRTAVTEHPGWREGALLVLEDVGQRPKAIGHT